MVTSDIKIISRMENAKNMGPTPVMIILDPKYKIKRLGKMLSSKPCSFQRVKLYLKIVVDASIFL